MPSRTRLLKHGLRFTRAQCNTAACSASRATLLTGLYPAQHGVKNVLRFDKPGDLAQSRLSMLPARLPNLATIMREAGYHVVLKGKFHLSRPVRWDAARKRHYWSEADVAHMALVLSSPLAAYVTGAIVPVDGGGVLSGSRDFSSSYVPRG